VKKISNELNSKIVFGVGTLVKVETRLGMKLCQKARENPFISGSFFQDNGDGGEICLVCHLFCCGHCHGLCHGM
jgi:hypothetical protein